MRKAECFVMRHMTAKLNKNIFTTEAKKHGEEMELKKQGTGISVVIPAMNEAASIGLLLSEIPWHLVDEVIVVDNGSTDNTGEVAESRGARVIREDRKGYGQACATGVTNVNPLCNIVVLLDGDYADHPEEMPRLIEPIITGQYDFVVGSRMRGKREPRSMTSTQIFGSWLSSSLIKLFHGYRYSDLGPFRAIRRLSLQKLEMSEMRELLRELDQIEFATQCPHGRPVLVEFSQDDLEKMFKRVV